MLYGNKFLLQVTYDGHNFTFQAVPRCGHMVSQSRPNHDGCRKKRHLIVDNKTGGVQKATGGKPFVVDGFPLSVKDQEDILNAPDLKEIVEELELRSELIKSANHKRKLERPWEKRDHAARRRRLR